ncbi:ABC transporter permease [Mycolicibacterium boenickei]|uniref:ABC transporter permease n=1 Tax=Mycolicibacterium boenickei TaxID=146017 RepID=A0AAX2ZPW8_9MYCO|nr:ABC transporter permease [Mycolicibacterium boenickei]PEG57187.1 peptide ABC transporter permease [Mycolicibacterium boenickei]UNB97399.1 ABC transporter permease [Mycolicibacterium boenickei]BBX93080.1 ABC transporter permease [Mycolicibacterium boenickei]
MILTDARPAVPVPRPSRRVNVNPWDIPPVLLLLLVAAMIVAPSAIAPYDPLQENPDLPLAGPSLSHPFGTDYIGRDLLSRVIAGTGATIAGSFIAVVIGLLVGTVLGLLAAYFGRITDSIIGRIIDVLLSIPTLLLSITIIVALGFGTVNAAIAVGISSIAVFARLARSEVLAVRSLPFVEASAHLGAGHLTLLFRHILPNAYSSVLALAALQFGAAILAIASLSFLGYGAQPPEPEWGLLISEGRNYINSSPGLVFFPALAIVLTVMSLSRLAHIIREKVG